LLSSTGLVESHLGNELEVVLLDLGSFVFELSGLISGLNSFALFFFLLFSSLFFLFFCFTLSLFLGFALSDDSIELVLLLLVLSPAFDLLDLVDANSSSVLLEEFEFLVLEAPVS